MEVQNKETKEIVTVIQNADGSYAVDGQRVEAKDMAAKYAKVKAKEKVEERMEMIMDTSENSWQSDNIGAIALALSKAQGEFESVDKATEAYNYKYATLADTIKMTKPIMVKHELALTQLTVSKMFGENLLSGVKSILMHSSGEWISSVSYLPTKATKSNNIAQVQGSWGSYTRRYHLMSMLGLATEDKDAKV